MGIVLGNDRAEIFNSDADGHYEVGARLNCERLQHVAFKVDDGAVVLIIWGNLLKNGINNLILFCSAKIFISP